MNKLYGGVILAGGKGSRLMPLTAKTPKPLLPLGNKTPLSMAIDSLRMAKVENIAITTGYLAEEIENTRFDVPCNIRFFREESPLGTAGMTLKILPFLEDDFFVVSADCIFDFSLSEMMNFHKERNADITIATVKSENPTEYGTILSENGKITSFREKPSWKQTVSTKINAGIYIIKRNVLEKSTGNYTDFASEIFPCILENGAYLASFETEGFWCDMGTPESYYNCCMYFSGGENIIGDYVSISSKAKISKSLVMNGVRVGNGTEIRDSVIGEGCSIGKNCILEKAIVGPDTLICDNVTVKSGSVIRENSILGKGNIFRKSHLRPPSFCDSGKVLLDMEKGEFFGKALSALSEKFPVYIFHDEKSSLMSEKIFMGCKSSGCKVHHPCFSTYSISSFIASEKNAYSVYVSYNSTSMFSVFVFDTFGILLSREEQLKIEKYVDFSGNAEELQKSFSKSKGEFPEETLEDNFPISLYTKTKLEFYSDFSGEKVSFLSDNLPTEICKKILISLGAEIENCNSSEDGNMSFGFRINDDGTEVCYIAPSGDIIDKLRLFAIVATSFPQKDIPLPDFVPEGVKNAASSTGGFRLYGDSIRGRTKDNCAYSFFDGISIVLAMVHSQKISGLSPTELDNSIPPFAFAEKTIDFKREKSRAIDALFAISSKTASSGIGFFEKEGKTLIIPDYGNSFKIFAEALSAEAANELIAKAEKSLDSIDFKG